MTLNNKMRKKKRQRRIALVLHLVGKPLRGRRCRDIYAVQDMYEAAFKHLAVMRETDARLREKKRRAVIVRIGANVKAKAAP